MSQSEHAASSTHKADVLRSLKKKKNVSSLRPPKDSSLILMKWTGDKLFEVQILTV